MIVASIVILVAFMTLVNMSSHKVQRLGFVRLGRRPTTRNGTERGPRRAIGHAAWSASIPCRSGLDGGHLTFPAPRRSLAVQHARRMRSRP